MSNGTEDNGNPNAKYLNGLRTIRVYNASDYEAPGFAIMRFVNVGESVSSDGDRFGRQAKREGEIAWHVGRPNAASVRDIEIGNFCFNGPTPLKPKRWGWATMDLPAQVLHNGGVDSLPNGFECGPIADKWYVVSSDNGGFGYHCMSHDYSGAGGKNTSSEHTVWLMGRREHGAAAGVYDGGSSVEENERVELSQASSTLETRGVRDVDGIVRVITPGYYLFGWQCTVRSNADRGAYLKLHTMRWTKRDLDGDGEPIGEGTESATNFSGAREQEVEQDGYADDIYQGAENVACTGALNLDYDEGISIKNVSSHTLSTNDFQFWLTRVGSYIREKTTGGGLVYPP